MHLAEPLHRQQRVLGAEERLATRERKFADLRMVKSMVATSGLRIHITHELSVVPRRSQGKSETRELCRAPNSRTRYSLSKLYHPGMRGLERSRKQNVWDMFLFNPHLMTAYFKCDVTWYKHIYLYHLTSLLTYGDWPKSVD